MLLFNHIISLVLPLITSFILIPLIIKLSISFKLYDSPNENRKIHTNLTPRLGGVAIFLATISSYFLFISDFKILVIVYCSIGIFGLGFFDDLKSIKALPRLVSQTLLALLAVYFGKLQIQEFVLLENLSFNVPIYLSYPFSVFIIIGAINALNMIDGMDGLAGGIAIISLFFLSLLYSLGSHNLQFFLLSFPLIGATLGFLKYNTHPAKIFMGDGGSNWLGFWIGILILKILHLNQELDNLDLHSARGKIPFISVILCFAIPIFDTLGVFLSRLKEGVNPTKADNRHLHHRLLKLGLNYRSCVSFLYFLAASFAFVGVFSYALYPGNYSWMSYAIGSLIVMWTAPGRKFAKNFIQLSRYISNKPTFFFFGRLEYVQQFRRAWYALNRYLIYCILIIPILFINKESFSSQGYIPLLALILTLFLLPIREGSQEFWQSLILAFSTGLLIGATAGKPMNILWQDEVINIYKFYNSLFILLFFSSSLLFLITIRRSYLVVTPSDFLLLLLPLGLLFLPHEVQNKIYASTVALRCLVVFIAFRFISKTGRKVMYRFNFIVVLGLLYTCAVNFFDFKVMH